jgi:hypothetical protein
MWEGIKHRVEAAHPAIRMPIRFIFHFFWGVGGLATWIAILLLVAQVTGVDERLAQIPSAVETYRRLKPMIDWLAATGPSLMLLVGSGIAIWRTGSDEGEMRGRSASLPPAHRDSTAFHNHVRDLHELAAGLLGGLRPGQTFDLTLPLARGFRRHFPDTAQKLDKWNDPHYHQLHSDLEEFIRKEAFRLLPQGGGLDNLLRMVVLGQVHLANLTWFMREGPELVIREQINGELFRLRMDVMDDFEGRFIGLWKLLDQSRNADVVREWTDYSQDFERLHAELSEELRTIIAQHAIDGECDLCRNMN